MSAAIDRRYVRTSLGLVHLRETGDGPILVLAHGNPWAGDFWQPVMPAFAQAGFRTVAFDALGHGLSDRTGGPISIETQATVMRDVVQSLGASILAAVGWHQGSVVALEFGLRYHGLCQAFVFDGFGTSTDADAVALMKQVAANNPQYPFAGNERTYWTDMVHGRLKIFDPHFELNQQTWPIFRTLLIDSLQVETPQTTKTSPMIPDAAREKLAGPAAAGAYYPWLEKLRQLDRTALILTSEDEPLRSAHGAAVAATQHGEEFIYPKGHPLMTVGREAEFVAPIARFLRRQQEPRP